MLDLLSRALIPIFFVIVLGYFAGATGKIDNKHVMTLNTLVMDFALPAAMFGSIVQTSKAELVGQWKLAAILAVGLVILWLLVYVLQRKVFKLSQSASALLAMSISLPNSAATAIALMTTVFGAAGNIRAVVGIAVGSIVLSPLTLVILDLEKAKREGSTQSQAASILAALRRVALSPLILAPLLAIVIVMFGWQIPKAFSQSFDLLGKAAGAVALMLTGLVLSDQRPNLKLTLKIAGAVILVNIIHPLLSWGLSARAVPLTTRSAILLSALPAGFFGILFAIRYKEDVAESASVVAYSTLSSIVTLSIFIALAEHLRAAAN